MPFYETDALERFVGAGGETDLTLDLRGLEPAAALTHLTETLRRGTVAGRRLWLRIDPATPTSGETLFLPVGRTLLAARRQGLVVQFHPLPAASGGGFRVQLGDVAGGTAPTESGAEP